MKETMSALGILLVAYFVLGGFIVVGDSAQMAFLLALACGVMLLCGSVNIARHEWQNAGVDGFVGALAAVLVLSLIWAPLTVDSAPVVGRFALVCLFPGIPLGLGYIHRSPKPLRGREIVAGVVTGTLGVLLALWVLASLMRGGSHVFVPLAKITNFDPLHVDLQARLKWDPMLVLLHKGHKGNNGLIAYAWAVQTLESFVAGIWDTFLLAVGAMAVTSVGRKIVGD
jgi:hypothetical protein